MAWNQLDLYSGILSEFAEHATECLRAWDAAQKIVGVGNSTVPFYRALQKAEQLRREALALLEDA